MQIHTTVPVADLPGAGRLFDELEAAGYDGANTYETKRDPFLPLALASQSTSTKSGPVGAAGRNWPGCSGGSTGAGGGGGTDALHSEGCFAPGVVTSRM